MKGFNWVYGISGSLKAVYRHKQRSFALIAGMILGAGILGGIFIYTDILGEANFNSIVQGASYEVRFDNLDSDKPETLTNVLKVLDDHPIVDSAIMMYGESQEKVVQTSTSYSSYSSYLNVEFSGGGGSNGFEINDIFGNNVLAINESDLGSEITNKINERVDEGSFSFSNRGIIVPKNVAETNDLTIGDKTNISLYIYEDSSNFGLRTYYNLSDVRINGIIQPQSNGGSFLQGLFTQPKVYLSYSLISEYPALVSDLNKKLMNFIAVKVDPNQLTLSDSTITSAQIDTFINEIEKQFENEIEGTNTIQTSLLGTQILSVFIVLFDFFLILPVFILGVYLISFGAQLALNDRKKEIAIYKIQGASPRQITRSVLGEILVLIVIGSVGAYIVSTLVGLSNSVAIGYMNFDFGANFAKLFSAISYLRFNLTAFMAILILGGGLLLYVGYNRSRGFIEAEVASVITKKTEKEESAIFRQKIDIIIFGIGVLALSKNLLNAYYYPPGQGLDFGILGVLVLDIPGPIFFWLGGAMVISRLARIVPARIDKYILKLKALNDVRIMIFADLRRRSVNTSRIALIIALAISFAVLASVQGTTHENTIIRRVQWQTGGDIQMTLAVSGIGSVAETLLSNSDSASDINQAIALGTVSGEILNDDLTIQYTDLERYKDLKFFQDDGFIGDSVDGAIEAVSEDKISNALVGTNILRASELTVGESINLKVNMQYYNGTGLSFGTFTKKITIAGELSHTPGGVSGNDVLVDYKFIQQFMNTSSMEEAFYVYNGGLNASFVAAYYGLSLSSADYESYYPASKIIVESNINAETLRDNIITDFSVFSGLISNSATYEAELASSRDLTSTGFGIAGLLTSMFIISLVCATIGTFIFISLLVNSRSKEFAILRSMGATESQIYKITLSEVISVLIFSLIAGILLGLGLSWQFNGFFEFMAQLSDPGLLNYLLPRTLVIPWDGVFLSMGLTALIIIIATILPTRSVVTKEIVEETRQV